MVPQLDLFPNTSTQTIIQGDCLDVMKTMADNSIDFIVTDPPYGLHFMGKDWDGKTPCFEIWQEALRICKPGAMLAAFGGSRTHHHLMYAIEWAQWEIRDVIMWLFGSGFPKSYNNFGFEGYGTALKPAYEPIILAMKPLEGTFKQNAEKWGVAGINIDACRIETQESLTRECLVHASSQHEGYKRPYHAEAEKKVYGSITGRWPANIILDEEVGEVLDEQSGVSKSSAFENHEQKQSGSIYQRAKYKKSFIRGKGHNDSGGASRFFYCVKASSSERNKGLEGMSLKETHQFGAGLEEAHHPDLSSKGQNTHPTVKPIALMKYIIKLLAPPGSSTLLDPFAGSGSTLLAAKELQINSIGIEQNEEYCEIARRRVA